MGAEFSMRTDRRTDMTKLIGDLRKFANAPKTALFRLLPWPINFIGSVSAIAVVVILQQVFLGI
jgi:hypothetical protein